MATSSGTSDLAAALSALNANALLDYQIIGQGAPASVSVGPGGASVVQTGAAITQTSLGIIVVGLVVLALIGWALFEG